MNTIRVVDQTFDPAKWNMLAKHPLQSWEWGEARKETGVEVVRLGYYIDQKLTNVFTMTLHAIPYTSYQIGYIPRSTPPPPELYEYIAASYPSVVFVKCEPDDSSTFHTDTPFSDTVNPTPPPLNLQPHTSNLKPKTYHLTPKTSHRSSITSYNDSSAYSLVPSPHPLFPRWTQVIDLTVSEPQLLNKMKSKTRYNIRLAQKKGVVIKERSDDEGFETFSRLYFATCNRQNYHGHSPEYHRIVWNHMKKNSAHILIAYLGDEPLAAYELFHFNKTLYYPYGGSSDKHRNVMAPNLLMWEAIRLGKKLGANTFDLWGSLPPNEYNDTDGWSGFTRFKEGYGTSYIKKPTSIDVVLKPTVYQLYNMLYFVRSRWMRL